MSIKVTVLSWSSFVIVKTDEKDGTLIIYFITSFDYQFPEKVLLVAKLICLLNKMTSLQKAKIRQECDRREKNCRPF